MNGTNDKLHDSPDSALLPYPIILAATKGDPDAMKAVMQHFSGYIASLSLRKLYDERGNATVICTCERSNLLTQNQEAVTTTEHKIGKTTYLVCASPSDKATDTIDKKIKKLIRKYMEQNGANAR